MLRRLGRGASIADVCAAAGMAADKFETWWDRETRRRLAVIDGSTLGPVGAAVEIQRDACGVPHIFAETEPDLFVGYGYAMAQDRLFQMDYLRRQALGRLSEVLGPEAYDDDLLARTVGLHRIAEEETARLPGETAARYEAFSAGVNAFIEACQDTPPVEFDLLDYRPEPWRPLDSIALLGEFRWYLTGRFPVIAVPELAKRALGEGAQYQAFLTAEAIDETILHPGEYASHGNGAGERPMGGIDDGTGSNNWVLGPRRSASGAAMVASDPHIAFGAPNCWYQAHLVGGRYNVAGAGYAGAPGILIGRNLRVAWGITTTSALSATCTASARMRRTLARFSTTVSGSRLGSGWKPSRCAARGCAKRWCGRRGTDRLSTRSCQTSREERGQFRCGGSGRCRAGGRRQSWS